MKRLLLFLWLWLAALPAVAIEIQTPDGPVDGVVEIATGEILDLVIKDLIVDSMTVEDIRRQLGNTCAVYWPQEQTWTKLSLSWIFEPEFAFRAKLPGEYRIGVFAAVDGALEHDQVTVVVGGGGPTPPPPPPPPPPPVPGHRWVIIVEESQQRGNLSPETVAALSSKKWRDFLDKQSHEWKVLDPDSNVPEAYAHFLEMAEGMPLPVLIIVDDDFADPFSGPFPDSADKVIQAVKKHGG